MKQKLLPLVAAAALLSAVPMIAAAHTDVFFGINLGALFGPPPLVYAAPPVVYVAPVPYPYYGSNVQYPPDAYYEGASYPRQYRGYDGDHGDRGDEWRRRRDGGHGDHRRWRGGDDGDGGDGGDGGN